MDSSEQIIFRTKPKSLVVTPGIGFDVSGHPLFLFFSCLLISRHTVSVSTSVQVSRRFCLYPVHWVGVSPLSQALRRITPTTEFCVCSKSRFGTILSATVVVFRRLVSFEILFHWTKPWGGDESAYCCISEIEVKEQMFYSYY